MLTIGTYLQNRYEILEQIGVGGMSYVYRAMCHTLNRQVAIKVLKEEFASDEAFVEKFKMEAQAAARLSHPNIVNVYDVVDEGELHYIVMELIDGITLKNYIQKKGQLETREAIGISIQVAQGIEAAHAQHIIHRDIKPQNMIIAMDGTVKVADFGIARAVSAQTMNAQAVGSVHYISPEQAKGEFCDERSDIYSFGITMYEMVTGKVPFEGDNTVSVALAHLSEPIPAPSQSNPKVGLAMEEIILKCTRKRPEQRYQSITEVIADLRKALVNPDSDLMGLVSQDLSQTKTLSPGEVSRIQEGSRRLRRQTPESDFEEEPEEEIRENPADADQEETSRRRGARSHMRRPGPKTERDRENVNPQFQRIFTGILVVVAIILVAAVLFVGAQVIGLFGRGTSTTRENTVTEASSEPQAVTITDNQVFMPNLLGKTQDEAREELAEMSLTLSVSGEDYSENYEEGQVMGQDIPEGQAVERGSSVGVTISKGSDQVLLTEFNLPGMALSQAQQLLEEKGLTVTVNREYNDQIPSGQVIRFSPDEAKVGESVVLVVSQGPQVVEGKVPKLIGHTQEEAQALLTQVNLTAGEVGSEASQDVPAGQVISQDYLPDTMLAPGTAVGFTVSLGPAETAVQSENDGGRYYLGSIDTTCSLSNYIGPASQISSVRVAIRLKQRVDNVDLYTTLIPAHTVTGGQTIPVSISQIRGAYGVDTGEVEVVNAETNEVIQSYTISFFPVE